MTYTEPSNEYVVENALPMKDEEGMNSSNYFEFSVTTKAKTNDADDNGVSIPYEITITESEGNTLTNDKIKMYVTEVEGEKELDHTLPTLVSYFEPSLYKDGQIKVGFNLHLHRNGNEIVTTKYRLRAWIDNEVDVSDWDTAGEFIYKFRVNVNGEATYRGYETNPSCFAYEENNRGNYSIIGYDFNKCGSKNIVVPTYSNDSKTILYKEIKAINMPPEEQVISAYGNYYFASFCSKYSDLDSCLAGKGIPKAYFEQDILNNFNKFTALVGQNYYDHISEINEFEGYAVSLKLDAEIIYGPEEEKIVDGKIDEIKSFKNVNIMAVNNKNDVYSTSNLNNIMTKTQSQPSIIANEVPIINGLIVPEDIIIAKGAFSTLEINQLVDRKGNFPLLCFVYTSGSNAITITDYKCQGVKNLRIASAIDNLPVTTLGSSAFANNQLTSVVIPDSITTIEKHAFSYNQLTSVVIPDSVTYLSGFSNNQLTSIKIPKSITTIGFSAFYGNKLTSVEIPESVTTIENLAFYGNKLTSVKISEGVITIKDSAFQNNQLTSIEIPNSVTTIKSGAFTNNKLKYVKTPDVLYDDFYSTHKSYNNVFAGNKITKIETHEGSFPVSCLRYGKEDDSVSITNFRCKGITHIDIPENIDDLPVTVISANAFNYLKNEDGYKDYFHDRLTSITIPSSVTTIQISAFANNELTSVEFPNSVTGIGGEAFYKTNESNPNLTKIINKGNSFDWNNIINGTSSDPFITGTVTNIYGNVEIVAE